MGILRTMSFEDQFYFNYGVSQDTYSNQPSTRIDIPRLLNGQAPFISPETQYRKGKKTIVLPGCYFAKLTPRQKLIVYAKTQQLKNKGDRKSTRLNSSH